MKKILITLLAIVLLSGCGKTKEPDPELLDCVKSAVLNYLNENGYDEDDSYEISAVYTSKGDEFPRIYDMTVNDKAVCGIMCYYYDEAGYGGINYPYKNGYVSFIVHHVAEEALLAAALQEEFGAGLIGRDGEIELRREGRGTAGYDYGQLVLGLDDYALGLVHSHCSVRLDVLEVVDLLVCCRLTGEQCQCRSGERCKEQVSLHNFFFPFVLIRTRYIVQK